MKETYKKILVAVDGSEQSYSAVREAIAIAERNKTSLFVLQIKDETRLGGTPYALPLNLQALDEESEKILNKVSQIIGKKVVFQVESYTGNPKKEIVRFAEEKAVELIVIGSNSKSLLDRILVGSTTTYVVSHAPCNVMVVK